MKRNEVFKRDNALIELLLDNKGRENALSKYVIADYLTSIGYKQNANAVHTIIERIIKQRHLPICSVNGKGYYWAKSKADILQCIDELKSRRNAIDEHIEHLENFIMD